VQNLTGATLPRAPKWNLSGGFNFETPVGSRLKLGVSGDVKYSSSYLTDSINSPEGQMPSFALVDASVRVGDENDKWQLALIGRNLTNRYVWVNSVDVPFTGSGTGTAAGIRADTMAVVDRGREIMLMASYKYH
jgi:iron complex outermembrane receptor protein